MPTFFYILSRPITRTTIHRRSQNQVGTIHWATPDTFVDNGRKEQPDTMVSRSLNFVFLAGASKRSVLRPMNPVFLVIK